MGISAIRRRGHYRRHLGTLALLLAAGLAVAAPARAESDSSLDWVVEDRLARLESELAQLKQQSNSLLTVQGGTSEELARLKQQSRSLLTMQSGTSEELGHIRAGLANAEIGLASLRASIDENGRQSTAALGRRVDRLEHLVAGGDSTGSISDTGQRRRARAVVPGWSVREVRDGKAVIAGKSATLRVEPGSVIPGLGRVSAVRQRGDRWVVMTDKGAIVQR